MLALPASFVSFVLPIQRLKVEMLVILEVLGRRETRRLHPLHVSDVDFQVNWNPQSRLQIGKQLPPLGQQDNKN